MSRFVCCWAAESALTWALHRGRHRTDIASMRASFVAKRTISFSLDPDAARNTRENPEIVLTTAAFPFEMNSYTISYGISRRHYDAGASTIVPLNNAFLRSSRYSYG